MRINYLLIICFLSLNLCLNAQDFYPWQAQIGEKILRLDMSGKTMSLLTSQRILQLENDNWVEKWNSKTPLTAAAMVGDIYWVGDKNGLYHIRPDTWQATPVGFESMKSITDIAAIEPDASGKKAIISSYQAGVFETDGISLRKVGTDYNVNTLCDCGGFRWLGTNAGLIRMKGEEVITYTEEGVKGFEIPDNVVDALYCPNGNRLVAVMPEAIDFFDLTDQSSASHGEHFDYVGERDNLVTDVLPMTNNSLLLLTEKGLLLLESQFSEAYGHAEAGFKEVFSGNEHAQVMPVQIGEGGWQKSYLDAKGNAWLVSKNNVVKIKGKKIVKLSNAQRTEG